MIKFIKNFANDESGATAIEYGLIAALIAVVLVGVMTTVGGGLETAFGNIADSLEGTPAAGGTTGGTTGG